MDVEHLIQGAIADRLGCWTPYPRQRDWWYLGAWSQVEDYLWITVRERIAQCVLDQANSLAEGSRR